LGDSRIILGISIPFTERKYVYSLDGIVTAGIDFEKIKIQPDEASKTITIWLPQPEIFSITPDEDSFTIYHNGDNPFNGLHLEETNEARKEMEAEIREKALKYRILDHATENAKVLINAFLSQSIDLQDWTINYEMTKENVK